MVLRFTRSNPTGVLSLTLLEASYGTFPPVLFSTPSTHVSLSPLLRQEISTVVPRGPRGARYSSKKPNKKPVVRVQPTTRPVLLGTSTPTSTSPLRTSLVAYLLLGQGSIGERPRGLAQKNAEERVEGPHRHHKRQTDRYGPARALVSGEVFTGGSDGSVGSGLFENSLRPQRPGRHIYKNQKDDSDPQLRYGSVRSELKRNRSAGPSPYSPFERFTLPDNHPGPRLSTRTPHETVVD